jgi:hypothetical protein
VQLGNPKRCRRRASFATRGMAILVATSAMTRKRDEERPVQMSVYCCPHCNKWHLARCKRNAAHIPKELRGLALMPSAIKVSASKS